MHLALSHWIEADLQLIGDYIALDNQTRARTFIEELEAEIHGIGSNPHGYRRVPTLVPESEWLSTDATSSSSRS